MWMKSCFSVGEGPPKNMDLNLFTWQVNKIDTKQVFKQLSEAASNWFLLVKYIFPFNSISNISIVCYHHIHQIFWKSVPIF